MALSSTVLSVIQLTHCLFLIRRLMDRLNNMKRNATGTKGNSACALCNDKFHLFGAQCHICKDCQKVSKPYFYLLLCDVAQYEAMKQAVGRWKLVSW